MLTTINFGPGLAPDVAFIGGLIHLAYGTEHEGLQYVTVGFVTDAADPSGAWKEVGRTTLDGFFNSFPRFAGEWLVYKGVPTKGFPPAAFNTRTGERRTFAGRVDGNWGIVSDGHLVCWQTELPGAWLLSFAELVGGATVTEPGGAPDGLERLALPNRVIYRKDIRLNDPAVGGYPQTAGAMTIGQYGFGTGVRFDFGNVRWLLGRSETTDPRCATDGTLYAVASWGAQGVRLSIGSRADFEALPLVPTETEPPIIVPPVDPPTNPDPPEEPPAMDLTQEQLNHLLRNQVDVIAGVKRDYPQLKGPEIVDQAIHRLNTNNGTDRYGRKARQSNGGNPNDDAITIRLKDSDRSQKKLIDVLGNANPDPDPGAAADVPTWDVRPSSEESGNGFWTPAVNADIDGFHPPHDPPDDDDDDPPTQPPQNGVSRAEFDAFKVLVADAQRTQDDALANVLRRVMALEKGGAGSDVRVTQLLASLKDGISTNRVFGLGNHAHVTKWEPPKPTEQ